MKSFKGNIVDIVNERIYKGEIKIENNKITDIIEEDNDSNVYIVPGLIDSHVHIESSMLIPSEFSKLAIKNGTVGIVTDPHEIANVMGIKGIEFMINNAKQTDLKIYFCIPSCVPTTEFETSGAKINSKDVLELINTKNFIALGEMMNYVGVINDDEEVLNKIKYAKNNNLKIDGHIPSISGEKLKKYINSGISTDHECFNIDEAIEKINLGMKILIREGSAAKNFNNLFPLINKYNDKVMFCTDDSHPDDLIKYGHINKIIKLGLAQNINIFNLLRAACLNPIKHYNLDIGLLQKNDNADFIIVDNLSDFNILETIINGKHVFSNSRLLFNTKKEKVINNFNAKKITKENIEIDYKEGKNINVIEIIDNELITEKMIIKPKVDNNKIVSDINKDILKVVVYNRYDNNSLPIVGFVNGFGLNKGALASSIAHDSHNIIAIGCDDDSITKAINEIIENKGGLCYVNNKDFYTIQLEFAGLITQDNYEIVAEKYTKLNTIIKQNGCKLGSAFMTLSFLSLIVIPKIKINDRGIFDVEKFEFINLYN